MFDIGFGQLLILGVVALIVLGPERLPKAARLAGLWVRRARAQWYSVRTELERELADEELKRSLHDARQALHDVEASTRQARDSLGSGLQDLNTTVQSTAAPGQSTTPPTSEGRDDGPRS